MSLRGRKVERWKFIFDGKYILYLYRHSVFKRPTFDIHFAVRLLYAWIPSSKVYVKTLDRVCKNVLPFLKFSSVEAHFFVDSSY